ncbi:MAG: peptidoglycan DD-metalloendopeptidase family protein [Crocinitomicaceae bacterium]|nr:peptidoglycan DD-metalloendopeptidase family protein [Crocinitomicaceae bacterium]
MAKQKYRFNPDKLSYEAVEDSLLKRIFKWLLYASSSILLAIILSFFFTRTIATPKETRLQNELDALNMRYSELNDEMSTIHDALDALEQRDKDLYRVALYADDFPEEYRMMGKGSSDKFKDLDNLSYGKLIQETSEKINYLQQRILGQSLSLRELQTIAKDKEKLLMSIPAIQPINNKELKRLSSGFGARIDPIYKTSKVHEGVDFSADTGTDVYATGDGVVEVVEKNVWGYGKSIVINHGFGYKTRYAHLSAFKVKKGDKVKRGNLIALVGNTGKSTGSHLHYEVELNGRKLNPIQFFHSDLTPEEYEKLIEISQQSFKAYD